MKHYAYIKGKLGSSNTTHQNLQSTDYYIEVLQVPYIYFILPNNGKSDRTGNESDVTWTDEYTKYLVNNLLKYNKLSGRKIFLGRCFTSVTLVFGKADFKHILEPRELTGKGSL